MGAQLRASTACSKQYFETTMQQYQRVNLAIAQASAQAGQNDNVHA